jgi:outer membrane protein assembly factor BamA
MNRQFEFFSRAAATRPRKLRVPLPAQASRVPNAAPDLSPTPAENIGRFAGRACRCGTSFLTRRAALAAEVPPRLSSATRGLASALFGALILVLCSFGAPSARASSRPTAQAQSEQGSATLASVEVNGSKRFTSAQIVPAIGLKVGSRITKADLQKAANTLAQLGPFSNVQYRYSSEANGVVVQFQVADAPALPVFFDNFPWFTDAQLDAALKAATPLYDGSAPVHGTLLDSMANSLGLFLVAHGYPGNVSHVLTTRVFSNQQVQEFKLDNAGVDVASVTFSDPLAQSDRGIHTRLADLVGKPYSRTMIELFELEQVRPVYLAHAYDHIEFEPAKVQIDSSNHSRVAVTIPIDAGPAYTWAGVTWTGSTAISPMQLDSMVPLLPGQTANGMTVEGIWQAVQDAFANRGYLDATVTPTPHYDDAVKHVSYTVAIDQGPQYRMGKLVLSGLSVEGERRIRGAWHMQPGQVFDKGTYDEFLSHGINEAFKGFPAHYDKIGRYLQKNSNDTVDVMMDFE